jgi:Ribbon-helix-helix domain
VSGKQEKVTFYLQPDKLEKVRRLSDHTRVSQADYFREAVDDLLAKYKAQLDEISKKRR